MKYYLTQAGFEFLKEGQEEDEDYTDSLRRGNKPVEKKPGKPVSPRAGFSDTPREGEVRIPEVGVTLPKAKPGKKKKK